MPKYCYEICSRRKQPRNGLSAPRSIARRQHRSIDCLSGREVLTLRLFHRVISHCLSIRASQCCQLEVVLLLYACSFGNGSCLHLGLTARSGVVQNIACWFRLFEQKHGKQEKPTRGKEGLFVNFGSQSHWRFVKCLPSELLIKKMHS